MRFDAYLEALARFRKTPLPGADGQLRMSPEPRRGWRPGVIPGDARHGGALLVVFPVGGETHVLLTKRAAGLRNHPGQISLPGGALEADETPLDAALREATEEVGLPPGRVVVDAPLSPLHVPVSRYAVHPFLAHVDHRPAWRIDDAEVERVLEVPLGTLTREDSFGVDRRERGRERFRVPYLAVDGERLWGATAMIVAEWLAWVGYRAPPWQRRQSSPSG